MSDLVEMLRANSCRFATETEREAAARRIKVDLEAADEIERLRLWKKAGQDAVKQRDSLVDEVERLRKQLVKAEGRIREFESAKVSIDVDGLTGGDCHRVFGRVVDWQPEDWEDGGAGKGIGVRLLCEYEGDNFNMKRRITLTDEERGTRDCTCSPLTRYTDAPHEDQCALSSASGEADEPA